MTRSNLTVVPPSPPAPTVSEAADREPIEFHAVNVRLAGDYLIEVLVSRHGALVRCWACGPHCVHEQEADRWVADLKERGLSLPWLTPLYDQDAVAP